MSNQGHNSGKPGSPGWQPVTLPVAARASAPAPDTYREAVESRLRRAREAVDKATAALARAEREASAGGARRAVAESAGPAYAAPQPADSTQVDSFDAATRAELDTTTTVTVDAVAKFEGEHPGWQVASVCVNDFHEASMRLVTPAGDEYTAGYDGDRLCFFSDDDGCELDYEDRVQFDPVAEDLYRVLGPAHATYSAFGNFGIREANRRLAARSGRGY